MELQLNKDTQLCMSLAARPGNFGTRFHNFLYQELGLNFIYKAFTTLDLAAALGEIRALGIRGCAISMPFKEACIEYLNDLDPSAKGIMSVNTIVNTDGYLKAYNTDYTAVSELVGSSGIPAETDFALRGSGGMAKAVACAQDADSQRLDHRQERNRGDRSGQAIWLSVEEGTHERKAWIANQRNAGWNGGWRGGRSACFPRGTCSLRALRI